MSSIVEGMVKLTLEKTCVILVIYASQKPRVMCIKQKTRL